MHTYLEFVDDKSSKFWEVKQAEQTLTIRYGRVGADGRTQAKTFGDANAALKEAERLVAQKMKKGYVEKESAAPGRGESAPAGRADDPQDSKPAAAARDETATTDGLRWVALDDGSALAIEDGKLVARNKAGKRLKSVSKKMSESEIGEQMADVLRLLNEHAQDCLEAVERWMLRSLPVPTKTIVALWPDPQWRNLLENTVVAPAPGTEEADDSDHTGILRAVDHEKGVGVVNLDGETVWMNPGAVVIPHPILLEDLRDWRGLVSELEVEQGLGQLLRETFSKPDGLDPLAQRLDDFSGGTFEMLSQAIARTRAIGCRVSGGFAVTTVWEDHQRFRAQLWIGAEDPMYETETGELMWTNKDDRVVPVSSVPPVSFSEGMRMASLIYAKRKLEQDEKKD